MFANLSLKQRMTGIGFIALLGLLLVGLWSALGQRASMYEERQIMLKSLVEAGRTQVMYYEDLVNKGKLSREEAQAGAREALRAMRFQGDNYFFIYTHEGITVLLPPSPEKEGQSRIDIKDADGVPLIRNLVDRAKAGGGFTSYAYPRPGQTVAAPKLAYAANVPEWQWMVGAGLYTDDIDSAFRRQLLTSGLGIVILALVVFGAVAAIARSVLRQLGGEPRDAMALMQQVSAGDLTVSLQGAQAGSLLGDLDSLIRHLRELIRNIHQGAEHISSASQEIRAASVSVAGAASAQAESTQGMAAAMEELTVSVTQISDNASDTDQYTRGAAQDAAQGEQQANATVAAMNALIAAIGEAVGQINGLSQRAQEVGSIAAIIKDIADQTNLLALNAAIEAARAGESGRGFAVVADEVRKLAERTTQATSDIERTLASIQSDTQGAVGAMHHASTQANRSAGEVGQSSIVLQRIAQGATQAQHLVADVADAAREQRTASTALAQQVEHIAQAAEETSHRMEETSHAAAGLERVAGELQDAVRRFRV